MSTTSAKTSTKPARRLAAMLAVVGLLAALGAGGASAALFEGASTPAYGADASWSS
jgi:hypothetical protein